MRIVSSVKELIGKAAKHSPEAAAAWAGICLLFEVLENPASESKAHRDGISHVVSRVDWYWQLSKFLESKDPETAQLRHELNKHVESLYKSLLSFQIKSVCSLYRKPVSTFLRNIIKWDDWGGALQSVKDAEKAVQQDIYTFNTLEISKSLNTLSEQARVRQTQLQKIYEAILESAREQEERQQDERTTQCLADLRLTDPRDDKDRIAATKGGLFRGASHWILDHDGFRRWRDADDARLLWIKGDPGKGKTMLVITIVEELERQLHGASSSAAATALAYFFCQGTDNQLNNAAAVLRGLWFCLRLVPWAANSRAPRLSRDRCAFSTRKASRLSWQFNLRTHC